MIEAENISSWVSKPDVCRCCLSGSGTCELTATYTTEAGGKDVKFVNILQNYFGVSFSSMNKTDASQKVCDTCMRQLSGAYNFHQQVVQADKYFADYWTSRTDYSISLQASKKLPKRRGHLNPKGQEEKQNNIKCDCDSDTPIARFKNSYLFEDDFVESNYSLEEGIDNRLQVSDQKVEISITGQSEIKLPKNTKQVSERRRIILTCNVVLLETTACPFRHHKSWFRCFFCTENFMEINTLRTHYNQTHTDIETELKKIKRYPRSLQIEISNMECRHCCAILTDVDQMTRHFVEKHNKTVYKECIADYKVNSSPYVCHMCKKEFHVFRTLTIHLNEHYANCICDVCGKSFLNSKRLKVHKRTHENGVYPCTVCSKVLKTKTSQFNHIESAHSKRIIKCQICFKPMKHYNHRVKHMSEVHNITNTFKCQFCDRIYNIKHYLATHIRQTHGHKNKKCKICNMAFITNHSLKKHTLKHTGERAYSCAICSKSYARSYTLKEHMRSHTHDSKS